MEVDNMIIGYARVSTNDQSLDVQIEAIKKYADEQGEKYVIYEEKESGGKADRKELNNALKSIRANDKLVVYKLDRLARSSKQLFNITDDLSNRNAEFVSISDKMDTTTAQGKAMFGMLSVFAEFERDIIRDRTKAGLESARKKGRTGGRPTIDAKTKRRIITLFKDDHSATDIAKEFGIGRSTVYKIVNETE